MPDINTPSLLPCPYCGSNTMDPATCLNWRSEVVGSFRRYRCVLPPPPGTLTIRTCIGPNGACAVDSVTPPTPSPPSRRPSRRQLPHRLAERPPTRRGIQRRRRLQAAGAIGE